MAQTPSNSAAQNPDININLRGLTPTDGTKGLIEFDHPLDSKAPQLSTLLEGNPEPAVKSLYQLHEWDSIVNKPSNALLNIPNDAPSGGYAPVVGFGTNAGQSVLVPQSGYDIGGGYQAVILYATDNSISLKYTPDSDVVVGYTVQLDNIQVDPQLLALYQKADSAGRTQLPALPGGYKIGVAKGDELRVAVRDTGAFMDPRWRADWWNKVPLKSAVGLAPALVAVDAGQSPDLPRDSRKKFPSGDEFAELCPNEEPKIGAEKNTAPTYRGLFASPTPEMRDNAGLDYTKVGVKGAFCGTSKSEPILLREVAPYKLKEVPQCKVVGWAGEIQFNYGQLDAQNPIPFVQEMANQIEGDWSAPFISEKDMEVKENLAYGSNPDPKAISEIQRREGVLKKILSSQVQDQMKCDLIEYVGHKGGQSIYHSFAIDGTNLSGISCPPNVTKPTTYTPQERAAWETQWGNTWKKVPLVPNDKAVGDRYYIICDDRTYTNPDGVPEVLRLGLSVNALWKTLTPQSEQEKFYKAGYEAMRDPLHSKELWGPAGKGSNKPQQPALPPLPYLANKPMDQLAKQADADPKQCLVNKDQMPRPDRDNGRCMHFVPTGQYDDNTLNTNVQRLKDMGVTWTTALYDDENVLARAAKAFGEAGIMVNWRKQLKSDQAPSGYPWARDIAIMKQYGNDDVKKNGPLIQLYNEPGDDREWTNGSPNFGTYLKNFNSMSQRIMAAGGRVGIQVQDPSELAALISKIQSDPDINQKDYWSKIFFVPHLYANGNPANWTGDDIGQLGFREYAEVFQQELGFVPPMIVGEGGPEIKEHPNDNPKFTRAQHAQYVADVYNQFATGKMVDGRPLPDYLMAFCNWVVDAVGDTRFQNYAWYNNLTAAGDLTQTINAVKALPKAERKFSCDKPASVIPESSMVSFKRGPLAKLQEDLLGNFVRGLVSLFRTNARVFAQTLERLPLLAQAGRLLAQGCTALEPSIEVVNDDPNNFVYALVVRRTACAPPGVLGDIHIDPPANYAAGNPGKTGPHVQSMTGNELRFLNTYPGASGFMPQVRSIEELQQYTWNMNADRLPEGSKLHGVQFAFEGAVSPDGGSPPNKGRKVCDPSVQCCVTSDCAFRLPRTGQMGPSDTGLPTGASHMLVGVKYAPGTSNGSSYDYDPVELIWTVPAWVPGQRPIPGDCSIVVEDKSSKNTCSGTDDQSCQMAGYEACNEEQGKCGNIMCMKVHDRVVDVYNSVPFLDSIWKQLTGEGSKTMSAGVYNLFKSPEFKGTTAAPPAVGCTEKASVVFDSKGKFTSPPGIGEIYYSFDQGFGVGAERSNAAFNSFGVKEVRVTQVKPEEGKKAKILYYRLGGLCNATTWLSRGLMTPLGFKNPGAMAAGSGSLTPGGSPGSAGFPGGFSPGGFGSLSGSGSAPASASSLSGVGAFTSSANVSALISDAPKETPRVFVVTSTLLLSKLPDFGGVAVDDHILVYDQSKRIVLYRPKTNTIISQPKPITVSVRNASGVGGLGSAALEDLRRYIPHVFVADQLDARRTTDITGTSAVSVGGNGNTLVPIFAQTFGWNLLSIPPKDEPIPAADMIIFIGKPRITIWNGTTDGGIMTAFEKKLRQLLPTAVIYDKGTAADTKQPITFAIDTTGTRASQALIIANALGVTTGTPPANESKTGAEFLILLGTDKK